MFVGRKKTSQFEGPIPEGRISKVEKLDDFIPLGAPIFLSRPMVAPSQSVRHSRIPTQQGGMIVSNKEIIQHPQDIGEYASQARANAFHSEANFYQRQVLGWLVP